MQVESALRFESPVELFARGFRALRPRTPLPEISVQFRSYADANSQVRLENGRLQVRVTDLLQGAPAPVLEALAFLLLGKLFRRPVPRIYSHRYRLYLNRRDVRRSLHLVRQIRGRKILAGPKGRTCDLDEIFEELNIRHFDGLLARPALSWSARPSRCTLGHYDPSHNAIIISRLLDSPDVPGVAVEYVLFHEMLHLRFPVEYRGARRRVHTPEFHKAEQAFPRLPEAKLALRRLRG